MGFKLKLSGSGYVVLNIIRALNIIALLACIAASVSMLAKTFIVTNYFFFDSIGHVVTIVMSAFLIASEVPVKFFKGYFATNWPLLSYQSGFLTLGIFMIIDGVMVLGNLNSDKANSDNFGDSFFQIIEAGGIIAFIMGIFNIIASYVFRDRKAGVTARMIRARGATAAQKVANEVHFQKSNSRASRSSPRLPLHETPRRMPSTSSRYSQSTVAPEPGYHIKADPEMAVPSMAAHPAYQREAQEWV